MTEYYIVARVVRDYIFHSFFVYKLCNNLKRTILYSTECFPNLLQQFFLSENLHRIGESFKYNRVLWTDAVWRQSGQLASRWCVFHGKSVHKPLNAALPSKRKTGIWCWKLFSLKSRPSVHPKKHCPFLGRCRTKFFWRRSVPTCKCFRAPNEFSFKLMKDFKVFVTEQKGTQRKEGHKKRPETAKFGSDFTSLEFDPEFFSTQRWPSNKWVVAETFSNQMIYKLKVFDWSCLRYHL